MLRTPQPHREASTIHPANAERDDGGQSVHAVPSVTTDRHLPSALAQHDLDPVVLP